MDLVDGARGKWSRENQNQQQFGGRRENYTSHVCDSKQFMSRNSDPFIKQKSSNNSCTEGKAEERFGLG